MFKRSEDGGITWEGGDGSAAIGALHWHGLPIEGMSREQLLVVVKDLLMPKPAADIYADAELHPNAHGQYRAVWKIKGDPRSFASEAEALAASVPLCICEGLARGLGEVIV